MKTKRGQIKAYKNHLNQAHGFVGDGKGANGRYKATKRPYGDYLYSQDRDMFMVSMAEEIQAGTFKY